MSDRPITIGEIQALICLRFQMRHLDLVAARKTRGLARPRQIAMYLCRELTSASLPQIGRLFGNRDHTTILYATRTVEKLMAQDRDFAAVVYDLRQTLTEPDQPTFPVTPYQMAAARYISLSV